MAAVNLLPLFMEQVAHECVKSGVAEPLAIVEEAVEAPTESTSFVEAPTYAKDVAQCKKRLATNELAASTLEAPAKRRRAELAPEPVGEAQRNTWWQARLPGQPALLRWLWGKVSRGAVAKPKVQDSAPESLTFAGCVARPELDGMYQCVGNRFAEDLAHQHPTYFKEDGAIFCYYWQDEDDQETAGWYLSYEVASVNYFGQNLCSESTLPPSSGWQIWKGSAFVDDAGTFSTAA